MTPIDPEKLKVLGDVELLGPGNVESKSKKRFAKNLEQHEAKNRKTLMEAVNSFV
jgi:hypothetical protein